MKLNKLQRYTAYCILLKEAKQFKRHYGLCHLVYFTFGFHNNGVREYPLICFADVLEKYFPELHEKNPYRISRDDFGWIKRIELLKQCIEELDSKIKWR